MTEHTRYVVDASVGIKLFVKEELSDIAGALLETMTSNAETRLYVPDLFFVECANVLWKYVARYGYAKEDASRSLDDLYALNLIHIPTTALTPAALALALDLSISVYDACYVAASDQMNAPLVTADRRLLDRLAGAGHQALYLGGLHL